MTSRHGVNTLPIRSVMTKAEEQVLARFVLPEDNRNPYSRSFFSKYPLLIITALLTD
jgi:hypothetical protein